MTDLQAMELLEKLDSIARDYDGYDYGLPLHNNSLGPQMIEAVKSYGQASAREQMERDCRIIQSDVEKDFPKQWELYMSDSNTADSDTSLEWLLSACVRESFEREAGRGDAS